MLPSVDKFQLYDYGKSKNKRKYGSIQPPQYNLTQITAPVYLFYAQDDPITSMKVCLRLKILKIVQIFFTGCDIA